MRVRGRNEDSLMPLFCALALGVLGMAMSSWTPPPDLPEVGAVQCEQPVAPAQC